MRPLLLAFRRRCVWGLQLPAQQDHLHGLNYRDDAAETKTEVPKEPVVFFKSTTSLVGPNDDLIRPRNSTKVDWEVELAVVMGKRLCMCQKRMPSTMWQAMSCTMTTPSAPFMGIAVDNG